MGLLTAARALPIAVALLGGCGFSPDLDGIYRCAPDRTCPPGLICAGDGLCRSADPIADAGPPDCKTDRHDVCEKH